MERVNFSAYGDGEEHFESVGRLRLNCDGTRAGTKFCLSAKRTSPFKSGVASVQSNTGIRGVCMSGGNAGYTMFRGSVRILATHSIRKISPSLAPPPRASPCAISFQLESTTSKNICMETTCET
jgi:hypothetical protein